MALNDNNLCFSDNSEFLWKAPLTLSHGGVTRCEAGWSLQLPWSRNLTDFDLWFVWAGRGRMELASGEVIPLIPGTCLWMRPGRLYLASQEDREPLGVTFRHFTLGNPPQCPEQEYFLVRDPVYFEHSFRKIALRLGPQSGSESIVVEPQIEAIFRSLLQECLDSGEPDRPPSDQETLIHGDMERIWESPGVAPPVAQLAREAGYSPDHYARLFRKVAKQTPREWRVAARMDRARRLLMESSRTIQEIADLLGYADVFFFSRQFKEKNGVSPRGWREGGRGN